MNSLPRGGWLQCRLIRRSSGFANLFHPKYELYVEGHQGGIFLAAARKSSKSKPNYHLSFSINKIEKTSASYLGKLQANLSRSDYVLFDNGYNPEKPPSKKTLNANNTFNGKAIAPRSNLALISYKPHLTGKTPRKLAVLLPILLEEKTREEELKSLADTPFLKNEFISSSSAFSDLNSRLEVARSRFKDPSLPWTCLLNKPPKFHAESGQYVLDFCGRAPQVSVKNFQLVYPEEPDDVLFQLGRMDDETFSVDFKFPLSPIQAFAIALSSLDYKWTVD